MRDVIRPFNARMSASLRLEVSNLYADGDTGLLFLTQMEPRETANRM